MADPPAEGEGEKDKLARNPPQAPAARTQSTSGTDPAIIREFIDLAKADIEIRQQEVEIKRQEKANAHEFSLASLEAQKTDRSEERTYKQTGRRDKLIGVLVGIVILGAFIIITLQMGYKDVALEIVKDLGIVVVAGYGGYAYGKNRKPPSDNENE